MPARGADGRGRGGIRAIRVQHDRNAQTVLRNEVLAHLHEHRFARRDIGAADEDCRSVELLGPACENAAVNESHHVLRRDAAIAEDVLHAGIDCDNAIEHAGEGICVELDQDGGFVGHRCRGQETGARRQASEVSDQETGMSDAIFTVPCPLSPVS